VDALPPLNSLRMFEAAARLGGFTRAAAELNVTQSAVSRQVATLEAYLGKRLFHRSRDGTTLTPAGEAYRRRVSSALTSIATATTALRGEAENDNVLRVRGTTFAAAWMMHRLPKFQAAFPDIQVAFTMPEGLDTPVGMNFAEDHVDLSIMRGRGKWPGTRSLQLFPDTLRPVCSPLLLRSGPPLRTLDDLRSHHLLHTPARPNDWTDWLSAVDRLDLLSTKLMLPNSVLYYHAAVSGLGVAVMPTLLFEHEIKSGILNLLFDFSLDNGLGYYAIWAKKRRSARKVSVFVDWLERECRTGDQR